MRPPCSGAVASTSAAAIAAPWSFHRRRRPSSTSTATPHGLMGDSSASCPLFRSLHIAAIPEEKVLPSLKAVWRPVQHGRRNSNPNLHPQSAAAASSSSYTPPPPVNYFDSDAFSASPPPPESLTRPAYNRYRATVDIERSTVQMWEEVIPSAGDPDWRPPPVSFATLARYPVPWLRFKILPPHLTFVAAELWAGVCVPVLRFVRRSWVVFWAAGIDRAFDRKARKENASSPSTSSSSSAASSSSPSALELALLRWHGKRSLLGDVREWALALRGGK